ncbi:MAG: YceD family protein [Nitrosomonas sp.]|nr:YceD family protein [Nitrosomonas sp.]MDP1950398.1 YceD family protein [Nitrosomonas sp.]
MSVRFVIDSLDYVRNARVHHGRISPAEFTRLQSYLFDSYGELEYTVSGLLDEYSRPTICILIKGEINLCCQRCLGKLAHTLDLQTNLLLVKNEAELEQNDEDDTVDSILVSSEMDVPGLVEDEIILSFSISLCHQEGKCSTELSANHQVVDKKLREHPFAALAELKKTH